MPLNLVTDALHLTVYIYITKYHLRPLKMSDITIILSLCPQMHRGVDT